MLELSLLPIKSNSPVRHDFKPFNMLKFFEKNLFFAVIIIKCSEVAMFFKKKYSIGLYLKENN